MTGNSKLVKRHILIVGFFFLSELMSTAILNKIIPEDFVNNSYIYPRQKYIIHNHNSLTNIIQAGLTDNTLHLKI